MRQVVGPGTRAQSVSGLIRVTMLRENRSKRGGGQFFFLFLFFDDRHLSASSSPLCKGHERAFVSGIKFERVVRRLDEQR